MYFLCRGSESVRTLLSLPFHFSNFKGQVKKVCQSVSWKPQHVTAIGVEPVVRHETVKIAGGISPEPNILCNIISAGT